MKKILPYFLVFFCALPILASANTNRVTKIFENKYFFDSTEKLHQIKGIKIPNRNNKEWCHEYSAHKFLQNRIRHSIISSHDESTFFLDKVDVRKILLAEGFAKINYEKISEKDLSNLQPFQSKAFNEKKNIWKSTCHDNRERHLNKKKIDYFKTDIGRVEKIINGNSFRLKNGPIIQIYHTKLPYFSDKSPAARCFRSESKKFLEHQLLGKLVQLKPINRTGSNPKFKVFRDVELLNRTPFKLNNLSEILIANGYAKHQTANLFVDKELATLQISAYKKPAGAWSTCSQYVFGESITETISDQESPETINCEIKGNISGSKKNPIKKFHTKKSPWYKRTHAETCFKTEDEAIEAGFEKVK